MPTAVPTTAAPTETPTSVPTTAPTGLCEPGTFINTSHADRCQPCPRGQFSGAPDSLSCTTCAAGRYAATNHSTSCTWCESGRFLADDGASRTKHDERLDCRECEADQVSSEDRSSCGFCAAGTVPMNISNEIQW